MDEHGEDEDDDSEEEYMMRTAWKKVMVCGFYVLVLLHLVSFGSTFKVGPCTGN